MDYRDPGVGSVWNMGSAGAAVGGVVAGIPNGRGRLVSSGSNAPLYVSRFLEGVAPDKETETHEERLAMALDIDRAGRILEFSPPAAGKKTWCDSATNLQTVWQDNRWVRKSDILGEIFPKDNMPAGLKLWSASNAMAF
jgi:hypothetical protein